MGILTTGASALATASPQAIILQSAATCPTQQELQVVQLINQERNAAGLPSLNVDIRLVEAARNHSLDMAQNDFFSHTGSDGSSPGDRLTRASYPYTTYGENIAAGYTTPQSAVEAWMNSAGHRAAILSASYEHIGVGYAFDSNSTYGRYWTADFGASTDGLQPPPPECNGTPTATPDPTPTPTITFADVPSDHWAHDYIEILYQAGYTSGCGTDPLRYCPDDTMNRAESAVFIERGLHGASFEPDPPLDSVFADVPLNEWFAKWTQALWDDGYTAGCGTDPLIYCPLQGHDRAEAAVFYLRMLYGYDYEPPAAQGVFTDVSLDAWYAKWVEAAYEAHLIEPCQTEPELHYCPSDPLTRALAAYMMVQAKDLK